MLLLPSRIKLLCEFCSEDSLRTLCEIAGLSHSQLALIIDGTREDPRSSTLGRVADLFGVSTDWLITGKGDEPLRADVRAAVERARSAHAALTTATTLPPPAPEAAE